MAIFYQHPNQSIRFDFSFAGNQEQSVRIFKNQTLTYNKNGDNDTSSIDVGSNTSDKIIQWTVAGYFKFHRGGQHGWYPSSERQTTNGPNQLIIGYDDQAPDGRRDYDYDDTVVKVTFS